MPVLTDEQVSLLSRSSQVPAPAHVATFSTFVGYSMCVNYILGVGVLGIPWGFYNAGLAFGILYMLLITVIAVVSVLWLVEIASRAEAVVSARPSDASASPSSISAYSLLSPASDYNSSASASTSSASAAVASSKSGRFPKYEITFRRFDVPFLCELFVGKWLMRVYAVLSALYFIAALCSYASVFAQSFSANVPFYSEGEWRTCDIYSDSSSACEGVYLFWLAVFSIIAVPLTCLDLEEQKYIQVALTTCRFLAIGTMTVVSVWALYHDRYSMSRHADDAVGSGTSAPYYASGLRAVKASGIVVLVPVLLYANVMHHSTPGLMQPLKKKWPAARNMFFGMYATTFVLYTMLGVSMALYYGTYTEPTASLNFSYFRGGAAHDETVPIWAQFVSYFVVLFPALDVLSAFPLNALTLGNTLAGARPDLKMSRKKKLVSRLVAAIPPILMAIGAKQLDLILRPAGLVGFVMIIILPVILLLKSRKVCIQMFGKDNLRSKYGYHVLGHPAIVYPILVIGILCMIVTVVGFFDEDFLEGK
eukprot:ANDGO_03430.mRNA.1 Transmembrane protein 104 homolog